MNRIRRIKHENFMTISNEIFRNPDISLKAKGLHAMVMGLPSDWDFSMAGLISISREGKHAIYTMLNELIAAGYAKRERAYENGKITAWNYVFIECLSDRDLLPENLEVENLEVGNLDIENQPQLNTQLIKHTKNQIHKEEDNPVTEIYDFWKQTMSLNGSTKLTSGRKSKIQARLREGYTIETLKNAVRGCAASPFHNGDNDRGKKYLDIELICRSGEKVESFEADYLRSLQAKDHGARAVSEDDIKMRDAILESQRLFYGQ